MAVPNAGFVKWKLGDRQTPLKRADQLRCTFDARFSLTAAVPELVVWRWSYFYFPDLCGRSCYFENSCHSILTT